MVAAGDPEDNGDGGFRNTSPTMTPSWTEQDEILVSLWSKGEKPESIAVSLNRSVAAVMTRAARLGLQRRFAPGRKPKKAGDTETSLAGLRNAARLSAQLQTTPAQQSHRICLMCLSRFQSAGRHNRICGNCKGSPEYRSVSGLPDVDVQTT
ncbi:MAG: hypothetical protein EB059_04180 [Alphaproteobacteria bacterium]|nr:hypothetical protein [Alphaproteobacteria bacterium]